MQIDADWITQPRIQAVMSLLTDAGHQAFFVGGCIRNALLNAGSTDIDIATSATPDTVIALANKAGIKSVPTGLEHGTVTLVSDHLPLEITTFRRDVETDGRRAVVAFSNDIKEDAVRRDFTMNALYADKEGTFVDPLGGLEDLQNRVVRFIEDPHQRIKEDYLRILRFFRFTALYSDPNNGIEAEGLAACAQLQDGIATLSKERIGHEMHKLLAAPKPELALAAMAQSGILANVLPGSDAKAIPMLIDLERAHKIKPNWMARLACLGGQNIQENLKLSRQETKELYSVMQIIEHGLAPATAAYKTSVQTATSAHLVLAALTEQALDPQIEEKMALGASSTFPIRAADLPKTLRGKEIGDTLKALENQWIESGFTTTKKDLLK